MYIKKNYFSFITALSLVTTLPAFAGEFRVSCSYTNDNLSKCAAAVSDIVTDKFIAKFPAAKFSIFVHSNISAFTNGGYSAYAVAGVIPANSDLFPGRRFSSTQINRTNTNFSQIDLAKSELETFRAAVTHLMEKCEISPGCDVYVAGK